MNPVNAVDPMEALTRSWRPGWPCPALDTMRQQRRGGGDPSYRIEGGRHWHAMRTPTGAATLAVGQRTDGEVEASAWGEGADWALDALPGLLGADDDISGFEPGHPVLAEHWSRNPHWRFGRSGLVVQSLVPTILEQKVTGQEALAGYRALIRRHGSPAPGPMANLMVPPTPEAIRLIPSWEWLHLHVDHARSKAVLRACVVADALERAGTKGPDALDAALRSLPGIGVWSSAEVRQVALGDADAVSFGDYHVAKDVGWAMTGTPFDDAEMATFLEPWRPHRNRLVALIGQVAGGRPRHGARMAPRTHLPGPTPGRR